MEFVIHDRESLNRLRNDRSLKSSVRRIRVRLNNVVDAAELETRLNRSYFACGCQSGAFAVYLALAFAGSTHWLAPTLVEWVWWKIAAMVLGAALLGKIVGLYIGRAQFKRALERLDQLTWPHSPPAQISAVAGVGP